MPLRQTLTAVTRALDATRASGRPSSVGSLTLPEEFELELQELGLSGKTFGPRDYAQALERYLGIRIVLELMNDRHHPQFLERLGASQRLAETHYLPERAAAVVLLPASLPPYMLAYTMFHELAHLATGDHLIASEAVGRRLACRPPLQDEVSREREADLRAAYAVVAGTLGPQNPYAKALHEVL